MRRIVAAIIGAVMLTGLTATSASAVTDPMKLINCAVESTTAADLNGAISCTLD
ncbi:hypothetical protein ACFQ2B_35875 [Streptomyces stramineus]|uniref:Uncharacterized protein n=1 Tax=Streptomyces stramineus TaxID=173861 RepID=A0ABP3J715_9ACTN